MLTPAAPSDFNFFYSLYMHPQVNPYLLYEIMEEQSFEFIFYDLLQQNALYKYVAEGQPVGMCKLIQLKHRNSHILYVGGLAVDPAHAGKNYGLKMLQDVIVYAKAQNVLRLELSVSVENIRAINLYKKIGFEAEGVLRKFTYLKSEDRFIDETLMSYIMV